MYLSFSSNWFALFQIMGKGHFTNIEILLIHRGRPALLYHEASHGEKGLQRAGRGHQSKNCSVSLQSGRVGWRLALKDWISYSWQIRTSIILDLANKHLEFVHNAFGKIIKKSWKKKKKGKENSNFNIILEIFKPVCSL